MQLANRVMEQVNAHNPDAVFVDGTGMGGGVHDRPDQLRCPNRVGVDFGARADRTDASDAAARYANKRAEMWGFMKEWLKVGSLPDDNELFADLKAVDYGYDGDALAVTFAYPVARRDWAEERRFRRGAHETEEVGRVIPRAAVCEGSTATIGGGGGPRVPKKQEKSTRSRPKLLWQICNICWTDE
jgi:hypothetical protein